MTIPSKKDILHINKFIDVLMEFNVTFEWMDENHLCISPTEDPTDYVLCCHIKNNTVVVANDSMIIRGMGFSESDTLYLVTMCKQNVYVKMEKITNEKLKSLIILEGMK